MKKVLLFLVTSIFCASVFSQQKETSRNRYALVIGNQNYKEFPLKNTVKDAEMITNSLQEKKFEVTFKKNLKSDELKKVIDKYIEKVNADSSSVSLVYIGGHGFAQDNKNYFLPVDNDKFHNTEDAKKYAVELEEDLAAKIKTNAQIYIVDGAYDNPFKEEGSRALGIKGVLSDVKNAREGTVGFLFSTTPGTVISNQNESSSLFARTLREQIDSSEDNLDEVFAAVKKNVYEKTEGKQAPYSSATTLKFSFNGDELTNLKKLDAIASKSLTSMEQEQMSRIYQLKMRDRAEKLAQANQEAEVSALQASEEVMEKRRKQQEEDARRAQEEAERAMMRSDSANQQIMALRADFESRAEELKDSMKKNASAEERVLYIEGMKKNLFDIRETARNQIIDNDFEVDAKVEIHIDEVDARPFRMTETKEVNGISVPTTKAIERRNDEKRRIREEGVQEKLNYKREKDAQVKEDDSKWLPQIKKAYSKLEGNTYVVTSLEDSMIVRVGSYDGEINKWKLHVSADLFGHADVFTDEIYLGYSEVTGKKNIDITKMNNKQFEDYNNDVEIYDALFKSSTSVFYVKLYYKIMRWRNASEYHFKPVKCEIVRLGKKNKVITKVYEKELESSEFEMSPRVEIRTAAQKESDNKRADKVQLKEEKLRNPEKFVKTKSSENKSSENKSVSDYSYSYQEKKTKPVKEKVYVDHKYFWGRNGFFITGNFATTDIFKNDYFEKLTSYDNPNVMGGELHLNFNLAKVYYWGLSFGIHKWDYRNFMDYASEHDEKLKNKLNTPVIYGKFVNGFAFPIGPYVRPFFEGGMAIYGKPYNFIDYNNKHQEYYDGKSYTADKSLIPDTDNIFAFNIGGGIDVILAEKFMITAGVGYNWMYYFRSLQNGVISVSSDGKVSTQSGFLKVLRNPDFHMLEFSVGIGFTW